MLRLNTHTSELGRIIVPGWTAMKDQQVKPLDPNLPGAGSPQQPGDPDNPSPEIPMYAPQGGYSVPGGPRLPEGNWQILSDGSIPRMEPIYDSNDLKVGGHNEPNGWYRRITGGAVDEEGRQYFTDANTRAVSYWGLVEHDFISGEQYDDYLDGGDGDDLIRGGAGNKRLSAIHSGALSVFWISVRSQFLHKNFNAEAVA